MVSFEAADNHLGVDVAAEAQLEADAGGGGDAASHAVGHVDDVAEAVGGPAQEGIELGLGGAAGRLGEMDSEAEAGSAGGLRGGREEGDIAAGRITAEVDADDATGAEARRQRHGLGRLGRRVAPVHREEQPDDEARVLGLRRCERVQHRPHVARLVEVRPRQRAWRRPQLQVHDAVAGEVGHDRLGRVLERGRVVDQVVDVRGEQGEEAVPLPSQPGCRKRGGEWGDQDGRVSSRV